MNYRTRTRSIRIRSSRTFCGQPLYDIAMGPDSEHNEMRGVARGFIAIGGVAIGGLAVGYYALGGNAVGKYVFSAAQRSDEAVAFFNRLLPGTK